MSDFQDPFDSQPLRVNEKGVKFWIDDISTKYATRKGLESIVVFLVEEPSGRRTRLVTENQEPLHEDTSLEGVATFIDMLKVSKAY